MSALASLALVARRLGDLRDRVVFVGGAVRGLLITDPAAAPARFTDDVDLIVELTSALEFHRLGAISGPLASARTQAQGLRYVDGSSRT